MRAPMITLCIQGGKKDKLRGRRFRMRFLEEF
ncbi:ATP-dependent RNA helicase DbpA [Bordetella pertussis]|nr:ATP-dependent RNA helicase DbpA [Bordetella pertussis]